MSQPYMPVVSEDPEIQEVGGQEGAGNGGSPSWMEKVKLKIKEAAQGVSSSSAPMYFRRLDQINEENEHFPSIFRPRHQGAAAVAPMTMTPSMDHSHTEAASSSRRSTGGSVLVAAVGPYHDQSSASRPPLITHAKKCAIVEFLARPEFGLDTGTFLEWALGNDALARRCYEPGSFKEMGPEAPEKIAEMHLLDGCLVLFAVFLLRKSSVLEDQLRPYPFCVASDRPLSESARTRGHPKVVEDFTYLTADISLHMKQTRLDLLLLGNQIPFFVLAELHRRLKDTFFLGIKRSIRELALSCFDDIRPGPSGFIINQVDGEALSFPPKVHHLLHLFHWSRVPPSKHAFVDDSPPLLGEPESNLPCATWFEDSLIGFSNHAAAAPGTLHMAFERTMLGARGVLRVPPLHIHGYSDLVFHNLIAFEQSHLRCGLAVTTYCFCMARLLQSEADAKLLRRSRILAHTHETDVEIVDLFRGLADEYRHASYSKDLLDLCDDVETHHRSTAARARKSVMLQCFPKQTVTFFVILGALISIATLLNAVFSVIRFYHPVKQQQPMHGT